MKTCRRRTSTGAGLVTLLLTMVLAMAWATVAHASPQYTMDCSSCHYMPPKDSKSPKQFKKDPATGAVPGNHETHAGSEPTSCVVCHGPAPVSNSHRNKAIELVNGLNYTRKIANGGFLNQTSVPPVPMGTCSNVSCHSDGKGHPASIPNWGSAPFTSPGDCGQCHGAGPTTGNHPTGANKHAQYYGSGLNSCEYCHADHRAEAKPFQHATSSRVVQVKFAGGGSFASDRCSGVYCHSDGQGQAKQVSWGSTLPADCSGCHGNAASAATLSGKHAKHVNSARLGSSYGCVACHASTVTDDLNVKSTALHVNSLVNYSGAKAGKLSGSTCSTVYCHSDGKGTMKTLSSTDWASGAPLSCSGCHGTASNPDFTSVAGEPNYANGAAPRQNSHKQHVGAAGASTCVYCHSTTTLDGTTLLGATHTDGTIDVAKGGGKDFDYSAKTCSNISCHAGQGIITGSKPATWGQTLDCNGCHDGAANISTSSHRAHLNLGTMGCEACHSATATSNTTLVGNAPHLNNAVEVNGSKIGNYTDKNCTTACHLSYVPKWGDTASGACGTCHKSLSTTTGGLVDSLGHAAHFTKAYGPLLSSSTVASCDYCHTSATATSHADGTMNLKAGYSKNGLCADCHKQTTDWAAASVTCQSCHSTKDGALSVIGVTAPDKTEDAKTGHGFFNRDCNTCHDTNARHITRALGDDKRIIGGLTGNAQCDSCHANDQKVTARTLNMQGHVGSSTACSACHDPHGTGNSYMVSGTMAGVPITLTGTTATFTGASFVNAQGTGICQACHTNTGYFKRGVNEVNHPNTNCLECHPHNAPSGVAFEPQRNCDSCHGYPPVPRNVAGLTYGVQGNWSSAKFEDYSGGGGAHVVDGHLAKSVKASDGWGPCLMCHVDGGASAVHTKVMPIKSHLENISVKIDQQYRLSDEGFAVYTGHKFVTGANKTGTCFNTNCHFRPSQPWSSEKP